MIGPMRRLVPVLCVLLTAACGSDAKREAVEQTGGDPARGIAAMDKYGCNGCHIIPGVPGATSTIGPSLEKIASRTFLGGQIQNTPENMLRWIQQPQEIDPGTAMPNLGVTDADARDIAAHLYTLR
jgi:cytochrome c